MVNNEKIKELDIKLINLMMEKFNITYDDIMNNIDENKRWLIDGKDWFQYYTMTEEEYNIFKPKAIKLIKDITKWSKKTCEQEFCFWWLNIGLIVEKENKLEDGTTC